MGGMLFEPGCLAKLTKLLGAVWKHVTLEIFIYTWEPVPLIYTHRCTRIQLLLLNPFCVKYFMWFLPSWPTPRLGTHYATHISLFQQWVLTLSVTAHWLPRPLLVCAEFLTLAIGRATSAPWTPNPGKKNTTEHVTSYPKQMQVSWEPFRVGSQWEMKILPAFAFSLRSWKQPWWHEWNIKSQNNDST